MTIKSLTSLLLLGLLLAFPAPVSRAQQPPPANAPWNPLLNGNDLKGWQGNGFWLVTDDGVEGCGPVAGSLQTSAGFADMDLRLEAKVTRGGAWALQFVPRQADGPTVSINLGGPESSGKVGDISVNDVLKQAAATPTDAAGAPWVNLLVTLKDGQLAISVNDAKVAQYAGKELIGQRFRIALSHAKGDATADFRNLQLQQSTPAIAHDPRGIDLLKLTDPDKDTLTGAWTAQAGGLVSATGNTQPNHVEFPYIPPAEYDYRIVFNRSEGDDWITTIIAADGRPFVFNYLAHGDGVAGFAYVDGKTVQQNRSSNLHPPKFGPGQHTLLIKVRKEGAEASIDGEIMATIKTDYSDMTIPPGMKQHHDDTIGISAKDALTLLSVEIIEITGQGKPVRP